MQDKKKMKRVKTCVERITENILRDNNHPLHKELTFLPSGRRLRQERVPTERFGASFIPCSINIYNDSH